MNRILGAVAVGALVAGILTGCSDDDPGDAERGPRADGPADGPAEVAWRLDGTASSQVVDGGDGVGVYYAVAGEKQLELRGVELATGKQAWAVEAATGEGQQLDPFVVDGKALLLAPGKGRTALPALVDVATGDVTRGTGEVTRAYAPDECGSADISFCVWGTTPDTDPVTYLWIHGPDLRVDDYGDEHPGEAENSDGLHFDDDARVVRFRSGGKVVWTKPWDRFFRGVDTARGWSYAPVESGIQLISGARDNARDPLPAARAVTFAVDLADGSRKWLKTGVGTGSVTQPGEQDDAKASIAHGVAVLCQYDGTFASTTDPGPARISSVVGVDAVTGKERWRMTSDIVRPGCALETNDGVRAGFFSSGKAQWLDITTGEQTPRAADEVLWVPTRMKPRVAGTELTPDDVFDAVDGAGKAVEPAWPLPEGLGVDHDDLRVVVLDGELRAYRAP